MCATALVVSDRDVPIKSSHFQVGNAHILGFGEPLGSSSRGHQCSERLGSNLSHETHCDVMLQVGSVNGLVMLYKGSRYETRINHEPRLKAVLRF